MPRAKVNSYIQEHYSDFRPIFEPIRGYAFFADLMVLDPPISAEVRVQDKLILLNETIQREESITVAQDGASRSTTAVAGDLAAKEYTLKIKWREKEIESRIAYQESPISAPVIDGIPRFSKEAWGISRIVS